MNTYALRWNSGGSRPTLFHELALPINKRSFRGLQSDTASRRRTCRYAAFGGRRVTAVGLPSMLVHRMRTIPYRLLVLLGVLVAADAVGAEAFRDREPQDEVVYFLLPDRFANGDQSNDRGGFVGGRLITGFDPTSKGFYHGGDLKGVTSRLDYIQSLGATAVWLAPVFKNKPVQGAPGEESAGYHGYWVTDFTRVDPHFGTEQDMRAFVEAAHARGMKVYLDIIANHTADVIAYKECPARACPYRSRAEYPYSRHGGIRGEPINSGFAGDEVAHASADNFSKLTRADFAYTPYVPRGEEHSKVPEWLNDPIYYHNRGNSTFSGESGEMGDFSGLDDLMTENPRVLQGFIDVFGTWIDTYRIDGYRIDTARHVNAEFWQAFVPAMRARAAAAGIPNFHIFGEVATSRIDVAELARYTRVAKLPTVLDFAFANAVRATVAASSGTAVLAGVFADDALYEGGELTARQLPTFISNHDMGRFAWFVRVDRPQASDEEVLKRVTLAHAMLLTLRGVPVIYYGDEQGFAGTGIDQEARQDMFASGVPSYRADRRIGITAPNPPGPSGSAPNGPVTTGQAAFDQGHPLYRFVAELSALRASHESLRRGRQVVRAYSDRPGLFAVSRFDASGAREIVVAFNTSTHPLTAAVEVANSSKDFTSLHGECAPAAAAPGTYRVVLAPLDFVVCAAGE
jgi:glycosidase